MVSTHSKPSNVVLPLYQAAFSRLRDVEAEHAGLTSRLEGYKSGEDMWKSKYDSLLVK